MNLELGNLMLEGRDTDFISLVLNSDE